jgi:hypothetical protein
MKNTASTVPFILNAAALATFLSEKADLVVGSTRGRTAAPSKYAPLLRDAGLGGGFEVMKMQNEKGQPFPDNVINVQKQNVRNALAALVESGEMPASHVEFMNIRPDGTPASEILVAVVKEGAPAKRAPRKAKEEPAAPVVESAPA